MGSAECGLTLSHKPAEHNPGAHIVYGHGFDRPIIISAGLGAVGGEPSGTLADLGHIDCIPAADAEGQGRWDELMGAEDFLSVGPLVGRRRLAGPHG